MKAQKKTELPKVGGENDICKYSVTVFTVNIEGLYSTAFYDYKSKKWLDEFTEYEIQEDFIWIYPPKELKYV